MLTRARFMRILGPAVAVLLTAASYAAAQQAVIVVRHAEKADQTPDTALSAEGPGAGQGPGRSAARRRRHPHHHQRVSAARGRPRRRSRRRSGSPPSRCRRATCRRWWRGCAPSIPASIVVVVGHSNTIPPMLTVLGWPNTLDLHEGDYDNVFVLAPHPGQRASMVRLKYGQPSS